MERRFEGKEDRETLLGQALRSGGLVARSGRGGREGRFVLFLNIAAAPTHPASGCQTSASSFSFSPPEPNSSLFVPICITIF